MNLGPRSQILTFNILLVLLFGTCVYERRPPRPPRLPSVLRFKDVNRSSLSFKKALINESKSSDLAAAGEDFDPEKLGFEWLEENDGFLCP